MVVVVVEAAKPWMLMRDGGRGGVSCKWLIGEGGRGCGAVGAEASSKRQML